MHACLSFTKVFRSHFLNYFFRDDVPYGHDMTNAALLTTLFTQRFCVVLMQYNYTIKFVPCNRMTSFYTRESLSVCANQTNRKTISHVTLLYNVTGTNKTEQISSS